MKYIQYKAGELEITPLADRERYIRYRIHRIKEIAKGTISAVFYATLLFVAGIGTIFLIFK